MTTIRAVFDGKVFVPDQPVDLPVGEAVTIPLPPSDPRHSSASATARLLEVASTLPLEDGLPRDYAAQVDHYLYGTPKIPENDPR